MMYMWEQVSLGRSCHVVAGPCVALTSEHEVREMFQYFAEQTYFGPQQVRYIAAANALVPGGFTNFVDWARVHMKRV